jgi:ComF family protein
MSVNCRRCQGLRFSAARACGIYEGALRETVLHLKREPNLCRRLIDRANAIHSTAPLNRATRIIPVPLHPVREKARGFNQAAVIAGELAAVSGLPLSEMSLIRISHSDRYRAGMDSQSRLGTVTRAFAVRYPLLVAGERILLVDDVYTTGATVSACADVLLEAGAEEVLVLTLARAQYT